MSHLFQNRFAQQSDAPDGAGLPAMEMLTANAGRDMPTEDMQMQTDAIVLESREQMLQRLSVQSTNTASPPRDGTDKYQEMMARIDSQGLSPMFAQEMDDFMNADVPVALANNT